MNLPMFLPLFFKSEEPTKLKELPNEVGNIKMEMLLDKKFNENRQLIEDRDIYNDFRRQLDRNWLTNCTRLYSAKIRLNSIKDRYGAMDIDVTKEQYNRYSNVCSRLCKEILLTYEEHKEVVQNSIDSRYIPIMFIYCPRIYNIHDSDSAKYINSKLPEAFYEQYYNEIY